MKVKITMKDNEARKFLSHGSLLLPGQEASRTANPPTSFKSPLKRIASRMGPARKRV